MESPLIHVQHLHIHLPQPPSIGPVDLGKLDLSKAVNATASKPRFELSPDGSYITDHQTGIQWGKPSKKSMSYDDGEKWVAGLTLGGLTGWGIGSLERRETITDRTRCNPAMPPPFEGEGYEWTSTEYLPLGKNDKGQPHALWQVYGLSGSVGCGDRPSYGFVRPCRLVSASGQ